MWLNVIQSVLLEELTEVFVEMTVVIIAVQRMIKGFGRMRKMCCRLSDPHDLQSLLTADAGAAFEISLQCPAGNAMLPCQLLYRNGEKVLLKTVIHNCTYLIDRVQRTIVICKQC